MPFKSKRQQRACFATKGFNGKVDCKEWADKTDQPELPEKAAVALPLVFATKLAQAVAPLAAPAMPTPLRPIGQQANNLQQPAVLPATVAGATQRQQVAMAPPAPAGGTPGAAPGSYAPPAVPPPQPTTAMPMPAGMKAALDEAVKAVQVKKKRRYVLPPELPADDEKPKPKAAAETPAFRAGFDLPQALPLFFDTPHSSDIWDAMTRASRKKPSSVKFEGYSW